MTLCEEGDEVLVPNPAFPAYPAINKLAGAEDGFVSFAKGERFWIRCGRI